MKSRNRSGLFIVLTISCLSWLRVNSETSNSDESSSELSNATHSPIETVLSVIGNKTFEIFKLDNVSRQLGNTSIVTGNNTVEQTTKPREGRCQCSNGSCGCCSRLVEDFWKQKACVNVTYDPDEFRFTAKMWMNDRVLYTRTVSGKNPRPVCIPIPNIPFAQACVRFYNIFFVRRNVHSCMNFEGKVGNTIIFKVKLDCISLGAEGVAVLKPEDGGLGQVEFLPTEDPDYDDDDNDYDDDGDDDGDDDDY